MLDTDLCLYCTEGTVGTQLAVASTRVLRLGHYGLGPDGSVRGPDDSVRGPDDSVRGPGDSTGGVRCAVASSALIEALSGTDLCACVLCSPVFLFGGPSS